jgi:hypothetical protein
MKNLLAYCGTELIMEVKILLYDFMCFLTWLGYFNRPKNETSLKLLSKTL